MQLQKQHPWSGCKTHKDITGCRFSLAIMCDDYVAKILNALDHVDTSHIWKETDLLSTTYRGHKTNVIDGVKALFIAANDGKTHMTLEATFSKGCPGDVKWDSPIKLAPVKRELANEKFDVNAKISFYPMGHLDYMDHIAHVINLAIKNNLYDQPSHYATLLHGDIHDLFNYFHEIFDYADEHVKHFVFQITLSINSPSLRRNESCYNKLKTGV